MNVYLFRINCRMWGFDTVAIVDKSFDSALAAMKKIYGETERIDLKGSIPAKKGNYVVSEFQE